MLAKKSSAITEILSERGLSLLFKYLPMSLKKRENLKLREKISFAAYLGGLNVANASTCLPHRLQQAMGCVKEISHPHACMWVRNFFYTSHRLLKSMG